MVSENDIHIYTYISFFFFWHRHFEQLSLFSMASGRNINMKKFMHFLSHRILAFWLNLQTITVCLEDSVQPFLFYRRTKLNQ